MHRRRIRLAFTLLIVAGAAALLLVRPDVAFREVAVIEAAPPVPADLAGILTTVEAWYAAPPRLREAYGQWLLTSLEMQRGRLGQQLEARTAARHARTLTILDRIFTALRLGSLAMLVLPLVFWRRYAGRRKAFAGYCVLAAVMLSLMFQLMGGLLEATVEISTYAGSRVNPQHAMLDAAFDLAEERVDTWVVPADAGGLPVGPTLHSVESSDSGDFLVHLLDNLQYFDVEPLRAAAEVAGWIHRLLGFLPHLVPVLVSLLFVITTRFLFLRIASMPMRAMRGEPRVARGALKLALVTWVRELGAVLLFVLSLVVPAISMQLAVRYVGYAVTEASVEQAVSLVDYVGRLDGPPDRTSLLVGLIGIPVALVLCLGVFALTFVAYSLWSRRLTQLRFHAAVPLRAHQGFWRGAWLRLLRIHAAFAVLLFFGLPLLLAILEVHPHADPDSALASLLWRGVLALGIVVAGVTAAGIPRDVLWLLRRRPARRPQVSEVSEAPPDETSDSPAAS